MRRASLLFPGSFSRSRVRVDRVPHRRTSLAIPVGLALALAAGRFGVYNHTSAALGYAWVNGSFDVGPSFSIYSMTACGATLCGTVTGVAPGGHVQASLYFNGPLGVSLTAHVDWVGGSSLVLPGGVAAMVVAGPVFRWSSKRPSSK